MRVVFFIIAAQATVFAAALLTGSDLAQRGVEATVVALIATVALGFGAVLQGSARSGMKSETETAVKELLGPIAKAASELPVHTAAILVEMERIRDKVKAVGEVAAEGATRS